eukprot:CAMPEP_0184399132 /NCGR_PEP_ID=MMETSP0007-20130409/69223_1 /TAXON_ID=97485 /ORGANISM="Prymnesium parvum, Strain Texoma1" /LENGTH=32 /DNA_ID= /DNA_START= /DNA_END= /DNA_ORIENTATION=
MRCMDGSGATSWTLGAIIADGDIIPCKVRVKN